MSIPISVESPLWDSDLEIAAQLCLTAAAMTDLDQLPHGSGDENRRILHNRKERFQEAWRRRMKGVSSLLELGLSADDCAWAAEQASGVTDRHQGWHHRFRAAESIIRLVTAID